MDTPSMNNDGDSQQPISVPVTNADAELTTLVAKLRAELADVLPLVEAARKHLGEIAAAKTQVEGMVSDIQSKATDAQNTAAAALAADQQIANELALAKSGVEAINTSKVDADTARKSIDAQLVGVSEVATQAAAGQALIAEMCQKASAALEQVTVSKATAAEGETAVQLSLTKGNEHVATLKSLADVAGEVQARITYYEGRLLDFDGQASTQLQTITDLLPGATSAGLASAFDLRRQSFLKPSTRWQWLFVGSVIALVVLALTGFWSGTGKDGVIDYESILSMWLVRLPIAAALVWLAMHSSRESALAKRLEEDYGYKAAMAASFQGFQKQMAEINEKASADSPLRKLCQDTLATIASPPGRIYEKQALTVTPGSELAGAARTVTEAVGDAAGAKRVKP